MRGVRQQTMAACDIPPEVSGIVPIMTLHAPADAIERAIVRYQRWHQSLPAQTSLLNHRLYLLQMVEDEAKDQTLKEKEDLVEAILLDSGVKAVGEGFTQGGERYTVLWRKIGSRYGVEVCFQSDSGKLLHGEFHD